MRFTEGEYARLQLAAADRGVSISDLLRKAALEADLPAPVPSLLDADAVTELRASA